MYTEARQDELSALNAELDGARRAQAQAERRAAEAAAELGRIQSGLAWRALVSYRQLARKVAPEGSWRGRAYDWVVGTARGSSAQPGAGIVAMSESASSPSPASKPRALQVADPDPSHAAVEVGPPGADTWFTDHYDFAAARVIEFLAMDGITLRGNQVADIGAGDGILDLGLVHKALPARLIGFDLNPIHADILLESARKHGVCDGLPSALEFEVSGPTSIPAEDGSFDVVVTWSAFEHISDPLGVLREARRVVRDDGALFLQVWPFYHSQFGSHLRDWFPEGWEHLEKPSQEIEAVVRASDVHGAAWADVMLHEFEELNRLTVDDLGQALLEAGFVVRRLNLLTSAVPIPPEPASRFALSLLGIEGVELTAVPLPVASAR